ncbi:DNA topoisomerase I [Pontibacterium sp. N1Y112]|uniref:DNA topoisomerase I n=1 Tax=Pontibacterium sinense TaxID=2781979 RepID=A0A8J7K4Y0_9GAMM|nr:DNA topoisomerase I [Pontibacterium sinense]MBE9396185.1 DNA topoisomerase I [Pontibacterium sinense]
MLQDNLLYVILICVVGIVAITVNYLISTREQQAEAKEHRLNWLRQQSETVFTSLKVLREIDCNPEIIDKLNVHAMAMYDEIAMLAPDSDLLASMTQLKEDADQSLPANQILDSDRALKRVQIYINFVEKLVLQMAYAGKISPALAKSYRRDLHLLKVTVVADAHLTQGNNLLLQGDKNTALSHYKHAKAILLKGAISHQDRQARLEKVNHEIEKIQPKRNHGRGTLADSIDKLM